MASLDTWLKDPRNAAVYYDVLRLKNHLPPRRRTPEELSAELRYISMGLPVKLAERLAEADAHRKAAARKPTKPSDRPARKVGWDGTVHTYGCAPGQEPPAHRGPGALIKYGDIPAGDPNAPFRGMRKTEYEAWRRANPNYFKHGTMDPPAKPALQEGEPSCDWEIPADVPDADECMAWLNEADTTELALFLGRASANLKSNKLAAFLLDDKFAAYKAWKNYKAADLVVRRRPAKAAKAA